MATYPEDEEERDQAGQTMAGLSRQFSAALGRNVVDKTGIAGAFDIHLEMTPAELYSSVRPDSPPGVDDPTAPPIPADALDVIIRVVQKLGLKLEPAKGTGEFLVIDHVERPSKN